MSCYSNPMPAPISLSCSWRDVVFLLMVCLGYIILTITSHSDIFPKAPIRGFSTPISGTTTAFLSPTIAHPRHPTSTCPLQTLFWFLHLLISSQIRPRIPSLRVPGQLSPFHWFKQTVDDWEVFVTTSWFTLQPTLGSMVGCLG